MHSPKDRVFGLDVLRAFAILGVLFHHTPFICRVPKGLERFFEMGWVGVDLFFVLSGYLIGTQAFSLSKQHGTLKEKLKIFWVKRWTRTLPLYFCVLLVYLFIKPLFFAFDVYTEKWSYFFFLQNFFLPREFPQSWSLCIEEHFYLIFPVFCFALKSQKKWIWLLPFAFSLLLRILFFRHLNPDLIHHNTLTHLDGVSFGIFLASTASVWMSWCKKLRLGLGLSGLGLVFLYSYFGGSPLFHFSILAVGFSLTLIGFYDLPRVAWISFPIEKIALWSYGAYLWNNASLRLASYLPVSTYWFFKVLVYFSFTFLISWITYVFIEKQGMALRKKLHHGL